MELFRKRMAVLGGQHHNALKQQSTMIREAKFTEHVGYMRVKVNDIEYDAHFTPSTEFSANENEGSYYIEFRHGVEFPMGTYVWIPNEQKGFEPWLITARPDNVLTKRVSIQKCNFLMKWQHDDDFKIIERWAVLRRPYSATIDGSDYIQYSIKEYRLLLPLDEETKKLHVDHRLVMEESNGLPLTYVITAFDSLSEAYSGTETVLAINVKQSASTAADNLDKKVADYKKEPEKPIDWKPISCHIDGADSVKIGGTGTVFSAHVDGMETDEVPVWSYVASDALEGQYTVSEQSGQLKIIVSNNNRLIGQLFNVTATFSTLGVRDSKMVKVVGIV